MAIIRRARHGVHRHGYGANFGRAEKSGDKLDRIREHDEDAVAGAAIRITESLRRAIDLDFQVGVSEFTLDTQNRRPIGALARRARDEFVGDIEGRHGERFYTTPD